MQSYFARIEALRDVSEVLWTGVEIIEQQGVIRQSYHFTPLFESPTSDRTVVQAYGYDEEWLKCYDESDFRKKDPIPARVIKHGSLLTWKEAQEIAPNSPEHEEYFAAMRRFGLEHGFGLPLFGPHGRTAYASLDFGKPLSRVDDEKIGIVRSVAQAAHQRVCVLLERFHEPVELSQREQEVLDWIARGKSASVIAEILDLSPDTVKTYSKRIYAKLGEADRIGAVVKAIKLGLVSA